MELPNDKASKPLRLFLSGGGYRAALASIGALLAIYDLHILDRVREITSVSGGGLTNSWLAVRRPRHEDFVDELDTLALILGSRANTLRAALLPAVVLSGWVAITTVPICILAGREPLLASALGILVIILTALCVQLFLARWWLRRLYRSFGGGCRASDLASDVAWPVRHTFVASDLSLSGSLFFSIVNGRLIAFSSRRGIYEPNLTLSTVLRASTALPPALPPIQVNLGPEAHSSGLGRPTRAWLADGGLTGNLGIQISERITGDNPFLESSVAVHVGEQAEDSETVVVDASGTAPAAAKFADVALWVPGLSVIYESLRSLKVQYEAALADDQHLARLTLVPVTRHAEAYHEAIQEGVEPEAQSAILRLVSDEQRWALLLGIGLNEHAVMCVEARRAAARMSTGLWPAAWSQCVLS